MKGMTLRIALVAVAGLISALPALAADNMGSVTDQNQQNQKDECLLVSKNCGDSIDTIQQRIQRINHEIQKGTAVYTREELMRLNSELQDANHVLESLMISGGA